MDNQESKISSTKAPLHRRIAENLSNQVSSGKLQQGARLPSERQIARQFNASRATVRTALQHLEQSGLISRRERRSAVVAIRRDITPFLRIACSHPRLSGLMGRLNEMQILPPRCQMQLVDIQSSAALGRLASQPATGADILICDLEYVNFFRNMPNCYTPVRLKQISDAQILPVLQESCLEGDNYIAVPLGMTPQVIYFNRSITEEAQVDLSEGEWNWDRFRDIALQLTHGGRYGFQFRPTFNHLAALMASRGGEMYQADGQLAARSSSAFEPTIRYIYDLLHLHKVTPLLAKADQLNLFASRRCATALDSFEQFKLYKDHLANDLQVRTLPSSPDGHQVVGGYALVVLGNQEKISQPVQDLIRSLLGVKTQQALAKNSGALPARTDLLKRENLEEQGLEAEAGEIFLQELQRSEPVNLPGSPECKHTVDNLFLELWLGLDNIESLCRRFKGL
jgi:DNA-binding transcriptional regulator YhcF (GntR family)/ABC-type glycerol-3-phosphate transport system substrate-binding protein